MQSRGLAASCAAGAFPWCRTKVLHPEMVAPFSTGMRLTAPIAEVAKVADGPGYRRRYTRLLRMSVRKRCL